MNERINKLFKGYEVDGIHYRLREVRVVKGSQAWNIGNAKALNRYLEAGFTPTSIRYLKNGAVRFGNFADLPC